MTILTEPIAPPAPPSVDDAARRPLPLRGADLPLLVSLDLLLEECNVTRAAARLHLSQPALSSQLARLRQLFDDPLLVPAHSGRGLVPSAFALGLQRRLRPALAALSSAVRPGLEAFRPDLSTRRFHIAATSAAAAMAVPPLLARLRAAGHSGLRFVVGEPEPATLAAGLEKGDIDLCFSPACTLPPGLHTAELLTTPHVLVQDRHHPRGSAPVTLAEYCEALDHVNVGRDSKLHGYLDEQLYRQGRSRRVAAALRDFAMVPMLLRSSDLVCALPARLVAALDAGLAAIPLDFPILPYTLCMAWHGRSDDDPGAAWLRGEARAAIADTLNPG